MIKITDVDKKYKSIVLFSGLNAEFKEGRIIMIKGPNGSGKSVLLKMITGYSKCDTGRIEVNGKVIRKDVDFIQDAGIFINAPEFLMTKSGLDNLLYLAKIRNKVGEDEIRAYAKMFNIEEQLEEKVSKYSLGMKQKLRIIQAIMEEPQWLIMDEPFDALDKKSVKTLCKIMRVYRSCAKTVIFTNHIESFDSLADEIYEIEKYGLKKVK